MSGTRLADVPAELPAKLVALARAARDAGGRALLVGGCVRDSLLGRAAKDWDVEVYGIAPADLRALLERFGRVNTVGESFVVYKLGRHIDVSLPRRERKQGRGHRGFVIEGDPHMSFEEAARRRDFTVNAIMQDPLTREIIDPYGGQEDLSRKRLRHVAAETFVEDSLRVLRAAQFAARFNLEVDPETLALCRTIRLDDLPAERIWGEIEKLLFAPAPSAGFRLLGATNATAQLFPEIARLAGCEQNADFHPEGDVEIHTYLVVDQARTLVDDLPYAKQVTVMLAALCHDFGKPLVAELIDGRWKFGGHDLAGEAPTVSFLDRLKLHTLDGYDVRAQTVALVREHMRPGEFYRRRDEVTDGAFRRLARRCELDLLYRVARADNLGRNAPWVPPEKWFTPEPEEWFIGRARELHVEHEPPAKLLQGRDLLKMGLQPSPRVGEIVNAVYELQIDGQVRTHEEAIDAARRLLTESATVVE